MSARSFVAAAAVACLASACGRIGYDPLSDAGADASAPPDGGCVLGPWEAPAELSIGGTSTATLFGGPSPSIDRRTLVFSMQLSGGSEDIYYATRADPDSPSFGAAVRIDEVSTPGVEGTPSLSGDGRTLYLFAQGAGDFGTRDIHFATRASASPADPFGARTPLPGVNDVGVDQGPKLTPDGLAIVWSSQRTGSTNEDLYVAERASASADFGSWRRVAELATDGRDTGGSLTSDGLTVYYATWSGGTMGHLDIWVASRPSRAGTFGTPTNVTPVNATSDEFDTAISADGLELFFVSTRGGEPRLFRSLRRCAP